MKQLKTVILLLMMGLGSQAQQAMTREMYIDSYYMTAIREMEAYGIPASITLAQGILESGNGNSRLAVEANNHFGIKCHKGWEGPYIRHDDDAKQECFRKYASADASYRDHSLFLTSRDRYSSLFNLKKTDYKGWAKGLKKAGYATSPTYAKHLIQLIEENHLYIYDTMDYNKMLAEHQKNDKLLEETSDPESSEAANKTGGKSQVSATTKTSVRTIEMHKNRIKIIQVKEGDSLESIEEETGVWTWEIVKYNGLKEEEDLVAGQRLFLQPKRTRGYTSFHQVKAGETLESISNEYGIKLKWILKRSRLTEDYVPKEGDTLWLRGWKKKEK